MLIFRQHFDAGSSTYTYLLGDPVAREAVLIDPVFEHVRRDLGPGGRLAFHPLMGGMDPDLGWESLELLRTRVMPHLEIEPPLLPGP